MKRSLVASLFSAVLALALLGGAAQAEPFRAQHAVTAELLTRGPVVPHCGTMHFIVVMRYRVLTVDRGPFAAGDEIYVAVSCPEQHGLRFEVGAVHALGLQDKRPWTTGSIVPDPRMPKPSPLYWAVELAKPAPAKP
ncbi:MAG: hypothetical protein EP329_07600 [Deltaproteobacteria bacterium]|nr:MAG: hypothetical protein EP329_07600 [Deltaproteobacteria bacterium]